MHQLLSALFVASLVLTCLEASAEETNEPEVQDQGSTRDQRWAERRWHLGLDAGSTLHMINIDLGWEFVFWERFILRLAIGAALTVGAHTEVTPNYTPRTPRLVGEFTELAGDYLDGLYRSYVFTPTISVGLGYRFF